MFEGTRTYELLYLIDGGAQAERVSAVKDRIRSLVSQQSGELVREEDMGKRKLAYAIKGVRFGIYGLAYLTAQPTKAKELGNLLKLEDGVVRHLILQCEKVPTLETATQHAVTQVMRDAPKPSVSQRAQTKEPMPSLEELDKKLDKILEEGSTNL